MRAADVRKAVIEPYLISAAELFFVSVAHDRIITQNNTSVKQNRINNT